jgi:NAD+ synthase
MMRKLDISKTAEQLTAFLKRTVTGAGFSCVVVAVSGGIDSAVASALAVRALGPEAVFPLLLPYEDWHTEAGGRAVRHLSGLGIPASNIRTVDITPVVEAFARAAGLRPQAGEETGTIRLGNIMARARMVILFDYAREQSALVLGTENKSEHYLGYFTRFGDEASDIEPLRELYKTEIYQLAEHLGVPQEIREAAPSAGLWPEQTDEGQFGFTYQTADEILYGLYDAKRSPEELAADGLDKQAIEQVRAWVRQMEFKHKLPWMPEGQEEG